MGTPVKKHFSKSIFMVLMSIILSVVVFISLPVTASAFLAIGDPMVNGMSGPTVTVFLGKSATIDVFVKGTGAVVSPQWQVSADDGVTWTDIADGGIYSRAQTESLAVSNITTDLDGLSYRFCFTNTSVDSVPAWSYDYQTSAVTLRVVSGIDQAPLTINGLSSSYTYGDGPFQVSVTGGSGTGEVTYSSSDPSVARVVNGMPDVDLATITILAPGTFTITATKASDDTYMRAQVTSGVATVNEAPQDQATQDVVNAINALPSYSSITTIADADAVADATNAFNALSASQQATISPSVITKLANSQQKAASINQNDTAARVSVISSTLPWYIRLEVTTYSNTDPQWNELASVLPPGAILLEDFEMKLVNTLTGESYDLPSGTSVTIQEDVTTLISQGYKNIIAVHKKLDGTVEFPASKIVNGKLVYQISSFSLFGVAANNSNTPATPTTLTTPTPKVTTPTNSSGQSSTSTTPATGDSDAVNWLLIAGAALLVAAGCLITLVFRKVKSNANITKMN